jgi:hypothetical protein
VHLIAPHFRCRHPFHRLHEQREGGGDTPGQGVRRPQSRSHPGEPERDVRVLTEGHSPFELGERPAEIALTQEQQTDPPQGNHEALGVTNRLGNSEPFIPQGTARSEHAQLGMAPREPGTGEHRGEENPAETLAMVCPIERCHGLPDAVDRPTIVTLGLVGNAEVFVRQRKSRAVCHSYHERIQYGRYDGPSLERRGYWRAS